MAKAKGKAKAETPDEPAPEVMADESDADGHGGIGGGEPKKCGAKKRQYPYTPCEQPSGWGTDHAGIGHCRFHGGSTTTQRTAAHRKRVDMEARILLDREGLTPVEDPLAQLQMLAAEVVKWKLILGDKIEEMDTWTTESLMESEEIRAVIAAYERALDRTNVVLSGMVRLNLEERQQKLSAAWGQVMVQLLEAVFGAKELGLNRKQLQTVKAVVARELPRFVVTAA